MYHQNRGATDSIHVISDSLHATHTPPGVNLPLIHFTYIFVAVLISLVVHEAGMRNSQNSAPCKIPLWTPTIALTFKNSE